MAFVKSHPKITAARAAALPVNSRSLTVDITGKLVNTWQADLDKRIINGYLATWGTVNDYGEKFIKGAFAKSISERGPNSNSNYKLTFLWMHDMRDPLARFAELEEDDFGLRFKTEPLDDVPNADRCITQIRSRTLNQFSVGFRYIWDKVEWDSTDDSLVLLEADLKEGSVVTIGADGETYAMRAGQDMESALIELGNDAEDFINKVPRNLQLELRQLLARHKTLGIIEPQEQQKRAALKTNEPAKVEGVYSYLSNILNLK